MSDDYNFHDIDHKRVDRLDSALLDHLTSRLSFLTACANRDLQQHGRWRANYELWSRDIRRQMNDLFRDKLRNTDGGES